MDSLIIKLNDKLTKIIITKEIEKSRKKRNCYINVIFNSNVKLYK